MAKFRHGYGLDESLKEDFRPTTPVRVGVIMGSRSDWTTVEPCCQLLNSLEVGFEYGVISAHRTSERMHTYVKNVESRGIQVVIACAGGSAHLPGMVASETLLPVLSFGPISKEFGPMDVIGSNVRMPPGVPLAFMGLNEAGAKNSALEAARILSLFHPELRGRLRTYIDNQTNNVPYTAHD